ncbi:MAG TPA: MGMT family protein, partial [Alphaproteobacteria bacterium]
AVGTACRKNHLGLIVPCHRVISANGIGGYGSDGVAEKRALLAAEGVFLK